MLYSRLRDRITFNFVALNVCAIGSILANTIFRQQMNEAIPNLLPWAGIDFALIRSLAGSVVLLLVDIAWLSGRYLWLAAIPAISWLVYFSAVDMAHFVKRNAEIGAPQLIGLLRLVMLYLIIAQLIDDYFGKAKKRRRP